MQSNVLLITLVYHSVFVLHSFMVLLETWNYAKVGLALGAMILCLSPQYPAATICGVPAEVAGESRAFPCLRTVPKLLHRVVRIVAVVLWWLPDRAESGWSMSSIPSMAMMRHVPTMRRVIA